MSTMGTSKTRNQSWSDPQFQSWIENSHNPNLVRQFDLRRSRIYLGYRKHDCYIVVVNAWYNMTCLWILLNRPALPDFNSSQSWALDFVPCADYFLFFVRSIDPPTTPNQFPAEFSLELVLVLLSWVSYPPISQPSFDCALSSE